MRNYDGYHKCQNVRAAIERDGYICQFTNLYSDSSCPHEVLAAGNDGWAIRRAIKAWAAAKGITDYRIFRATDYLKDLHGTVYECFVRPTTGAKTP